MQEGSTGLYYMRFRYYDSATARFLSRDPIPQLEPRAINPYQYAAADPMSNGDPLGLKGQSNDITGWATRILFGLGGAAKFLEDSAQAFSSLTSAKALATDAALVEGWLSFFDHRMDVANYRWLRGVPFFKDPWGSEWWWVRALTREKYLEMFEKETLKTFDAMGEIQAAAKRFANLEATAIRFSKAASALKTAGSVVRVLGAIGVALQSAFAGAEDIHNGAGFVVTYTDVVATAVSGLAGFHPVVGVVDLLTGGAWTGFIHNAPVTPNTAASVIFSRTTSRDAEAVKAVYTRFPLGRKVWDVENPLAVISPLLFGVWSGGERLGSCLQSLFK